MALIGPAAGPDRAFKVPAPYGVVAVYYHSSMAPSGSGVPNVYSEIRVRGAAVGGSQVAEGDKCRQSIGKGDRSRGADGSQVSSVAYGLITLLLMAPLKGNFTGPASLLGDSGPAQGGPVLDRMGMWVESRTIRARVKQIEWHSRWMGAAAAEDVDEGKMQWGNKLEGPQNYRTTMCGIA